MPFLYLTTKGWKTGRAHEIEIWYVSTDGGYYLVSEMKEKSHWVQNIKHDQKVSFKVDEKRYDGTARIIDPKSESGLVGTVRRLMDDEYSWSNGTIVELKPVRSAR